jgi:ankyrin repeat protein
MIQATSRSALLVVPVLASLVLFAGPLAASSLQQEEVAALFEAVDDGSVETVNRLLDHGVDVNAWGPDGFTPLQQAAAGGHANLVAVLLERGADANAVGGSEVVGGLHLAGLPALMWAAVRGHEGVVTVLVEHGVDANARDARGRTALMLAAWAGDAAVMDALLDAGADVNEAVGGETALTIAAGVDAGPEAAPDRKQSTRCWRLELTWIG